MPTGEATPRSAATLAWNWVIEELACCKEFDSSILAAILRRDPSIVADPVYGAGTMKRLVLRFLEELADWTEVPPSSPPPKPATVTPVPVSKELDMVAAFTGSVLCPNSLKVGELDDGDESWRTALHQFILQKRDALPKTSFDLPKDSILEDCRQGASSSRRFSCLLRGDQVRFLQTDDADDVEIASKKLKLSISHIQQVNMLSVVPSKTNQNLCLEGATSRHEDQLSKQNVQIVTDDNDACLTEQNIHSKFPVEKNKRPLGISQSGDNKKITDVPTDGSQNALSESSSDSEGYYNVAPDFYPSDEVLAAEKLKLLNSQNPVNNDFQIGDWTQQRSCIKCNEGGLVLICTRSGCPIAVHESCLGSSVEIENPVDFKCPFCSYLLAASAYYEARKKFSTARKTLSSSMGWGRAGLNKVPPLTTGSSYMRKPSNGNNSDNVCANQRSGIVKEPERKNQAKATSHGYDGNFHAGEEHHFVDRNRSSVAPSGEKEIVNEYHVISAEQNPAVVNDKLCRADAATSQSKETDKGSSSHETGDGKPSYRPCSNGHAQAVKHQKWANADPDTVSLQCEATTCENQEECKEVQKQGSAIEHDVDPQNNFKIHNGEYSSRNERKHRISLRSSKRYTSPMFPYARRNRLPWTHEEEAILMEAMQKFYQNGEKSISWIKILEFGRHIFHKTRQPADLKDKWRNIRMREG